MKKSRKRAGKRKKQLEPLLVGVLSEDSRTRAELADRGAAMLSKLDALLQHYAIDLGDRQWLMLSIALAREFVPGFAESRAARLHSKWTIGRLLLLAGDMRRELDHGAPDPGDAARKLASREPWRAFLKTERWSRSKALRPDPAEEILEQYELLSERYRTAGEQSYRSYVDVTGLTGWDQEVSDALLGAAAAPE